MFDPFDAFDPIDPVPAAEPEAEREPVEEREAAVEASDAAEAQTPEPHARPARRWTTTASRPVQPNGSGTRAHTSGLRVLLERPAPPASMERSDPTPADVPQVEEPAEPDAPSTSVPAADLASLRAAALTELRGAAERLRAHGHVATVTDGLDQEERTISVRFRPDPGPLAPPSDGAPAPARFELRVAPDLDGGAQVVAGYARGSVGAPLALLGRTHVDQIDRSWVARRFIEFVQRVLELD